MIELKANKNIQIAMNVPPQEPIWLVTASWVSSIPLIDPSSGTPETNMIKAVEVQMINVSVNTPKVWMNPCLTGWLTVATAAAFGADPIPASFENKPLFIPWSIAAPKVPPKTCSKPKAFLVLKEVQLYSYKLWMLQLKDKLQP